MMSSSNKVRKKHKGNTEEEHFYYVQFYNQYKRKWCNYENITSLKGDMFTKEEAERYVKNNKILNSRTIPVIIPKLK